MMPSCRRPLALVVCLSALAASPAEAITPPIEPYDVVVYGATSAGAIAGIQAANMGKSVVVIEPGKHIGGLTSGGLGATDIGNKAAIGGLSREFYRRIFQHYAQDDSWKFEKRGDYRSRRQQGDEPVMWTFEPHVAEQVYIDMLKEAKVPVIFGERLKLENGVTKNGAKITSIRMESGRVYTAKVFIDASYEGDLMAKAGVSYHVGREANSVYDETLNGVQVKNAVHHQFIVPVDPFVVKGDPSSGLLPGVTDWTPEPDGTGDKKIQAYCFRMCTTDAPENRRPWPKPEGYDPLRYELVLRNCEAGDSRIPWNPVFMPNRKTDTNNNFAISTDNIGMNYDYPEGDYATRERILREHEQYQKGLMWTLANSPRVPDEVKQHFQRLGLAKDEFVDNDNWPHQLYIREARRMISDYVMTQHDCQGRREADDPVGLAAYTMDSHNIQRYYKDGWVKNEGDVQVGGFSPYPISYRSLRPRKEECSNLLVPICMAASHIAYGSIRMEPVFMVLGQSAATAACQSIDAGVAVQDIPYDKLREKLLADSQVLAWTGPKRKPPVDPASLPGLVIDDADAELVGAWLPSRSIDGYVGQHYLHDAHEGVGQKRAVFRPEVKTAGRYDVRVSYTANPNRASNVTVVIKSGAAEHTAHVNQKKSPGKDGFASAGTFSLEAGKNTEITISNAGANGHVVVDAVQLLPVK